MRAGSSGRLRRRDRNRTRELRRSLRRLPWRDGAWQRSRGGARNGGVFPLVDVMAKIDGYAKGEPHHGAMPSFWPLLEGRMVLVETGDDILTPTPEPLLALARYLESIQE